MIIKIEHIDRKIIELECQEYMQIGIIDIELGNKIYDVIESYFSGTISSQYSELKLLSDGAEFSRKAYKVIGINSFKDIDELLTIKKDSILEDFNNFQLDNIDLQNEIILLEQQYLRIVDRINEKYIEDDMVYLEGGNIGKDLLSIKKLGFAINQTKTYFQKLQYIVYMISYLGEKTGNRYLLYLNHLESYLSTSEVHILLEKLRNNPYVFLVIATSNSQYLNYDDAEQINFLYDSKVIQLMDINSMQKRINNNIKENQYINIEEIKLFLQKYSFNVIQQNAKFSINDQHIYDAILLKRQEKSDDENLEIESTIII